MLTNMMEALVQGVALQGYAWIDGFLSQAELQTICLDFKSRQGQGKFKKAGVGKQGTNHQEIRNDSICWLNKEGATAAEVLFMGHMDDLVIYFNSTCYLGINNHEFHYAQYPHGGKYVRHLDQFKANDSRKLSVICYLNQAWLPAHGGQLRIYPEGKHIDINPIGGRLMVFKSDELEHEVLATFADRSSITGWFRDDRP